MSKKKLSPLQDRIADILNKSGRCDHIMMGVHKETDATILVVGRGESIITFHEDGVTEVNECKTVDPEDWTRMVAELVQPDDEFYYGGEIHVECPTCQAEGKGAS